MKKMFPWLITMLLSITLIALVAFLILKPQAEHTEASSKKEEHVKKLSAEEIVKVTSVIQDIKTNLSDTSYVVSLNLAFQLNNAKAKEDFDKIADFKVKPIIIKTLADKKPGELVGAKGKDQLCAELLNKIDKVLPEGSLSQVEVTYFVMTQL